MNFLTWLLLFWLLLAILSGETPGSPAMPGWVKTYDGRFVYGKPALRACPSP